MGCTLVLVLAGLLLLTTCLALTYWVTRSGEVSTESAMILGDEQLYASLYLAPDDLALVELVARYARALGEAEERHGSLPIPMGKLREMQSRHQISALLPLRIELSLHQESVLADLKPHERTEIMVQTSFSGSYRQLRLIYKLMMMLKTDEQVHREEIDGKEVVSIQDAEGELGVSFVENHLFFALPPERLKHFLARGEVSTALDLGRRDELFAFIGGRDAPLWGFADLALLPFTEDQGEKGSSRGLVFSARLADPDRAELKVAVTLGLGECRLRERAASFATRLLEWFGRGLPELKVALSLDDLRGETAIYSISIAGLSSDAQLLFDSGTETTP